MVLIILFGSECAVHAVPRSCRGLCLLRPVGIGERDEPCDQQGRNGACQYDDEEHTVAQMVAEVAAQHARQHDPEVHDAAGKGIVGHLVPARRYLLHHEERQTDEAEAVAEVFHDDTAADQPQALGLVDGKQRVGDKGDVEHQGEREKALLQPPPGDVVAGENRTDDERRSTEGAVAQADFLLAQSQSLLGTRCLEEERDDLHHESLGKAVEDDETDIIYNVSLPEEIEKHLQQLVQRIVQRDRTALRRLRRVRQDGIVIDADGHHDGGDDQHDQHPGLRHAEVADERAGKIDQPARRGNLRNVVECPLPAYPPCLLLVRQHGHISAVGCDVVRRTAHGDHREYRYRDREERGKMERKGHQGEEHACEQLRQYDKELLCLVNLQERTPQRLQCPGQHDERGPESDLRIAHAHSLVHQRADHVEHDEGHTHGEVKRRHPRCRTAPFPVVCGFLC